LRIFQEAVIKQQRHIRELEFQVEHLRRLPSRNRQGIRLMIDGLHLIYDRIQEATEKEEEIEEKRRQ